MANQIDSDPRLADKIRRIIDGHPGLLHHAYHLNNLVHADPICDWLLRYGFTGQRLLDWMRDKHEGSVLYLIQYIVAHVNHSRPKPLLAGKDYVIR